MKKNEVYIYLFGTIKRWCIKMRIIKVHVLDCNKIKVGVQVIMS